MTMWNELKLTHHKSWWNKFNFYCLFVFKTDATIYVGGLDEKVTETLLWELFLQAGPVGKHVCRLGGGGGVHPQSCCMVMCHPVLSCFWDSDLEKSVILSQFLELGKYCNCMKFSKYQWRF